MIKKIYHLLVLVVPIVAACASAVVTPVPLTPSPTATLDVRPIVKNVSQIREERIYLVTLKFKKDEPLDPIKNMTENEWSAEHRTLMVGERTYNQYEVGAVVSQKSDILDFVFNGNLFTSYVVSVEAKEIVSQYFWQDNVGIDTEVTKAKYDLVKSELAGSSKPTITVPYAGVTITYVLNKPLNEYVFVDKRPLVRYFIQIQVKNETLTLGFTKWLRNAYNTHEIDLEVPKEVFDQTGEVWDPQVSVGSLIFKGHISTLHGTVLKKWTEDDPNFLLATTSHGKEMIIPAK